MKRKAISVMVLASFLLISALFADSYFKFGFLSKIMSFIKPFAIVTSNIGANITSGLSNINNIGNLQNENKELTNKLNSAMKEIARLNESQKENISLKKELGFKVASDFDLLPSQVLSFDPSNIRDTVLIDVGSNDGVKQGQVVLSEGYLVGKIAVVYPETSKLMLVSDPLSAIPAAISEGNSTGVIKGRIGSGLLLEQVPQSEKIDSGNTVVTSGLGGDFPKGIIIGKVDEIQKVSGSIFQSITVRPVISLNQLERVMIIK